MTTLKLALLVSLFIFSIDSNAKKIYRVAVSSSCPYYCTDGDKQGYIVDILRQFFKKYNIQVKFETTPYARLKDSLKRGNKDLALFTSFDLRDFSELMIYDVTLGVSSAGIISKVGTNPVVLDVIDLKEKTIFLVPGSMASDKLYKQVDKINTNKSVIQLITGSRIHDRLINLIALGRADYAIEDYNVLRYFYSKSEYQDRLILTPSSIFGYSPLKFVSRKGLPIQKTIQENLKGFIQNYRESGKLKTLLDKYNIIDWNIVLTR